MNQLWKEYILEEGVPYFWQIGLRKLWIMHRKDEWLLATDLLTIEADEQFNLFQEQDKPEDLTWQRIVCNAEPRIRLMPMTPNQPVIVDSEYPVTIMPKNRGQFYMMFRCWISVQIGENFKTTLLELPTVLLSNSWFGNSENGLVAYSLKTSARRSIEGVDIAPNKIICPVSIYNNSSEPLDFEKICVHVEFLRIYRNVNQLWSNEIDISYQGDEKGSVLKYSDKFPESHQLEENALDLLVDHRESPKANILKRSLSLIKNITELRGV